MPMYFFYVTMTGRRDVSMTYVSTYTFKVCKTGLKGMSYKWAE